MTVEQNIHNYIWQRKSEIVDILKTLIKIPSVKGEAKENAPFGAACAEALSYTQKLYESYGFATEADTEGGYLLSYFGKGEKALGLFAHADVVPVSDDWILTKPFEPLEKDGFIVGRGAMDDKAAIVVSLFCARMLKELQLPFQSRLVCFTGSNEESGMRDIKKYVQKHAAPDFSLVCDTGFPLYRGNKGRILLKVTKNSTIGELKSFVGGKAGANVANAAARLSFSDSLYEWLKAKENDRITVKSENGEIVISAVGIGNHAALPAGSINAAALIAGVLCECELLSADARITLQFIRDICSDYYGGCLGIDNDDTEFGKLTFVNYQIHADAGVTELHFNIRHGLGIRQSEIENRLTAAFKEKGFDLAILDTANPYIVPKDNPMLIALMDVYKRYTGNADAKMYVNAGGTYGRFLPCAAEIGLSIGGGNRPFDLPQGHGSVHQPDECISVEGLLNAIELTTLMVLKCDEILGDTI